MIVFVTGGTGYVGSAVVRKLLESGHEVRCLVRRKGSLTERLRDHRLTEVPGDLLDSDSYKDAMRGAEAVIHLVGIIREKPRKGITFARIHNEGTKRIVEAAKSAGIKRFVHMSALGARPEAISGYHLSKWNAEEHVRRGGIPHIILRPSVIFGPGDEFVNMLAGIVKAPLTPVFGNGLYRMQPVSLHTVAELLEKALTHPQINETYEVGGPEQIPYNEMLKEVGRTLGRPVRLMHVPLWITKPMVSSLHRIPAFPVTKDQLTMLLEENICRDGNRFVHAFEVQQIPFSEGIREYL